jgi:hypothetical protein
MQVTPTISAVFERFHFHSTSTVASRVFSMLAHVLPRKIRSQSVDLSPVVANKKDKIFGREIARPPSSRQGPSLDYLYSPSIKTHEIHQEVGLTSSVSWLRTISSTRFTVSEFGSWTSPKTNIYAQSSLAYNQDKPRTI